MGYHWIRSTGALAGVALAVILARDGIAQERYAGVELRPEGWMMREMKTFSGSTPSRAWVFGRKRAAVEDGEKGDAKGQWRGERRNRAKSGSDADSDAEVLASILVTEGIAGGIRPQKQSLLLKLYVESVIRAWGGKSRDDGVTTDAASSGGGGDAAGPTGALSGGDDGALVAGRGEFDGRAPNEERLAVDGKGKVDAAGQGEEHARRADAPEKASFCGRHASYSVGVAFGALSYTYYGCLVMKEDLFRSVFLVTWMPEADDALARARFAPFLDGVKM